MSQKSEDASQELSKMFTQMRDTPSAVNTHMDVITHYARLCDNVAEFGIGRCDAMLAIMNGLPEYYRGYCTNITPGAINVAAIASQLGVNIHLAEESSIKVSMVDEELDMVVLDDNYWRRNGELLDDLSWVHKYIIITHVGIVEDGEGDYTIPDFSIEKYVRPTAKNTFNGLLIYRRTEQ